MIHLVIISYSSSSEVTQLVNEFRENNDNQIRIHVVDNKGEKNLKEFLKPLTQCSYYHWGNLGYGPGFNKLISSIKFEEGDLFIISNDDVKTDSVTIRNLIKEYERLKLKTDKLGIICPSIVSSDGTDSDRFNEMVTDSNELKFSFIPAVLWLFDSYFLKHVGGFQPSLFLYGEDRELCDRSKYLGYQNFLVRQSKIVHDFNYPPRPFRLRVMMEKNTMIAQFLNPNKDRQSVWLFTLKGSVHALLHLHVLRLAAIWTGFALFCMRIFYWKSIKKNHTKAIDYRYIDVRK